MHSGLHRRLVLMSEGVRRLALVRVAPIHHSHTTTPTANIASAADLERCLRPIEFGSFIAGDGLQNGFVCYKCQT